MNSPDEKQFFNEEVAKQLPILFFNDILIFPQTVTPIVIEKELLKSVVEVSQQKHQGLFILCYQKEISSKTETNISLPKTGVVSKLLQVILFPNGKQKLLVEGLYKVRIHQIDTLNQIPIAHFEISAEIESESTFVEAAKRHVIDQFRLYAQGQRSFPMEVVNAVESLSDPFRIANFVSSHIFCPSEKKQSVLDAESQLDVLIEVSSLLNSEIELSILEKKIDNQVRDRINRSQKQFYLQEQLKQIKRELGEVEDSDEFGDIQHLRKALKKSKMPKIVRTKVEEELERLKQMPLLSPEASVIRSYLDWLFALPWVTIAKENRSISDAQTILNDDHYGLEKPKERILEYLAVLELVGSIRGPILCFVGPPGVGKTSLGRSIARALNRSFVRVSLGGVRDEAEIRGHRRTYIGSMPGRIIQGMKKAGTKNPVFLLDEIDKMNVDFRGDPASALLEVLDPEQNKGFSDHYLEVEYDLSEVFFITTANTKHAIPEALLDRMEIIPLLGYLSPEKLQIAKQFLVPKQLKEHGLSTANCLITDDILEKVIDEYTRESGVRELERQLATICRKSARQIAENHLKNVELTTSNLEQFLGVPKFVETSFDGQPRIGTAIGLAWTSTGGELLKVQVVNTPGKGKYTLTGQLGDVMKESGFAALSLIKTRYEELHLEWDLFEKRDLHVHVPEGAVPKDGPSAGITLATALYSSLSKKAVRGDFAMTGEVTLEGDVLPIGGLPEKLMSAKRMGIPNVILPKSNLRELSEVPVSVREGLTIFPVSTINEVWKLVIVDFGT